MPENFELLDVGQIEIMHEQVHSRLDVNDEDCDMLRVQHDSLAAELVKRGMVHDTEIICPESELARKAPNYRRGFTDDICTQCAFGQLFPFCNLYKADYTEGYTCDSFRYFEMLELEPPHGFLMAQEKQTAIASENALDNEKLYLIVSGGEVFGIANLEQGAQVKAKEFDSESWLNQHRVTPRERRQWWPGAEVFYIYRLKDWHPYEGVKLYEGGQVIDEPKLTAKQWQIVSKAKELPKQIVLLEGAVSVTDTQEFVIDLSAKCKQLDSVLSATYQIDVKETETANELIPLYSLALVRNPRMRVLKKSVVQAEKQEGEDMPFGIVRKEDEFCVINTDTEKEMGCHETEEEAEAQLAALRINVEAEEGESAVHTDKPRKRKPKKKEMFGGEQSIEQQLNFIRRQFEDQFNHDSSELVAASSPFIWIADIFDSFVIADDEGNLFRVNYMKAEDEIIFVPKSQWVEVERGYSPKGFKQFDQPTSEMILQATSKMLPEKAKKAGFMDKLKSATKTLLDIITLAENEKNEVGTELLTSNYGIAQKEVNGELWHFTWSTNAFEDREGEIFSTKSLENYVLKAEKKADRGYFNLWHINAEDGNFSTDFARKEWQGVVGRFLVEAGPYLDNGKGQAAKEFFSKFSEGHPEIAPEGWGCSPEFRYLPEERAAGVYENIWITRTSTLPKFAAANVWTETRQLVRSEMTLTKDQMKAAIAAFGKDEIDNLISEAEKRTVELEAANVAHKSEKGEEDEPQQSQEIQLNMEDLAAEVGKQFTANLQPIAEAIATMADGIKELEGRLEKVEETKAIKDKTETPRFVFNLQRASEDAKTVVTEDDGLKDQKPKEAAKGDNDAWSQIFNK